MVSATKHQEGFRLGVTPRQLEEARQAAQEALNALVQPEEVRPGQWLCCRGRVTRAVHIAGQRPQDEWPALQQEVARLAAIADQRFQEWLAAERRYRELCKQAGSMPALSEGESCTCEGCQIEAANIEAVSKVNGLPVIQGSYRSLTLGFDHDTQEYVLFAPSQ